MPRPSRLITAVLTVLACGVPEEQLDPMDSKPVGLGAAPVISNVGARSITTTSAMIAWQLDEPGTGQVEYGTTTAYGTQTPSATAGGNAGKSVSVNVTNLAPNTTYHFRLVATNPSGTDQGADATFTTTTSN